MGDHEQMHEEREREADALERDGERLAESAREARGVRDRAASDELVASPGTESPDDDPAAGEDPMLSDDETESKADPDDSGDDGWDDPEADEEDN